MNKAERLDYIHDAIVNGIGYREIGKRFFVTATCIVKWVKAAADAGDQRFIDIRFRSRNQSRPDPMTADELAAARMAGESMTHIARRLHVCRRRITAMDQRLREEGDPRFREPWPIHESQLPGSRIAGRKKPGDAPPARIGRPPKPPSKPVSEFKRVIGDVPITVCPPGYAAGGVSFLGGWPEKPGVAPSEAKERTMNVPQHLHRPTENTWAGKYNHRDRTASTRKAADKVLG